MESSRSHLPENEELMSKPKKKKTKKSSPFTTDEDLVQAVLSEENLSLSPRKKKKKNRQQSADITNEEATLVKDISSKNDESISLSAKKKKKKDKWHSETEQEADTSIREADEAQGTSTSKSCKPTAQKKASVSKGFVLFVGQIPHHIKQKDIEKHFSTVGMHLKLHFLKSSKNFALVLFSVFQFVVRMCPAVRFQLACPTLLSV